MRTKKQLNCFLVFLSINKCFNRLTLTTQVIGCLSSTIIGHLGAERRRWWRWCRSGHWGQSGWGSDGRRSRWTNSRRLELAEMRVRWWSECRLQRRRAYLTSWWRDNGERRWTTRRQRLEKVSRRWIHGGWLTDNRWRLKRVELTVGEWHGRRNLSDMRLLRNRLWWLQWLWIESFDWLWFIDRRLRVDLFYRRFGSRLHHVIHIWRCWRKTGHWRWVLMLFKKMINRIITNTS